LKATVIALPRYYHFQRRNILGEFRVKKDEGVAPVESISQPFSGLVLFLIAG